MFKNSLISFAKRVARPVVETKARPSPLYQLQPNRGRIFVIRPKTNEKEALMQSVYRILLKKELTKPENATKDRVTIEEELAEKLGMSEDKLDFLHDDEPNDKSASEEGDDDNEEKVKVNPEDEFRQELFEARKHTMRELRKIEKQLDRVPEYYYKGDERTYAVPLCWIKKLKANRAKKEMSLLRIKKATEYIEHTKKDKSGVFRGVKKTKNPPPLPLEEVIPLREQFVQEQKLLPKKNFRRNKFSRFSKRY